MRSSIDEALLRTIMVNPGIQNEQTVNACSYLDLTVKPVTSKMNATTTPLADVVAIAGNASSHHLHAQVSPTPAITTTATAAAATVTATSSNTSLSSTSQYNQPPICLVSHLSSNINQDLAEADQSIENDVTNNENVAANSPELSISSTDHSNENGLVQNNEISNEGAVGGILSETTTSTLPDLAKVTTITNNSTTLNTVTSNCDIDYVDTDL